MKSIAVTRCYGIAVLTIHYSPNRLDVTKILLIFSTLTVNIKLGRVVEAYERKAT